MWKSLVCISDFSSTNNNSTYILFLLNNSTSLELVALGPKDEPFGIMSKL